MSFIFDPSLNHLVIFGLGREGWSSWQFFHHHQPDLTVTLVDDKPLSELAPQWQTAVANSSRVRFFTSAELDHSGWDNQTLLIKTAGIPYTHPLLQAATARHLSITTNTQLFFELTNTTAFLAEQGLSNYPLSTIGVTGTKGKSTTTSVIYHVLKENQQPIVVGGNIGVPPLDLWPELSQLASHHPPQTTLLIALELSCHQLSDLRTSPHIAVVQDITPEHLDYYATFEEYVAAKAHITAFQTPNDYVIYNPEFAQPRQLAEASSAHKLPLTEFTVTSDELLYRNQFIIKLSDIPLKGQFNLQNVMPAIVIGAQLGLSAEAMAAAIKTFLPLSHRLELVGTAQGVEYYNDSLSTTPVATIAALDSFAQQPVVLVAGGYDRHLEYDELARKIVASSVTGLVLFPNTGERIWAAVERADANKAAQLPHVFVEEMPEAVQHAAQLAAAGGVVLLSPASASFNHFKDYADRGHQFAAAVAALPQ
ncbi:MAG TPA: UDP-N-acetylmuramoyl-L-alanine--D-glutamate ligase [Vitreimonas sp.]|nr:UDP-N-acetylmuramoyl-L-alanine--D-glutamate ligase [Vitreimonas sp.]